MIESVEIRCVENGYVVAVREKADEDDKKNKKDSCCLSSWEPPKDFVFESVDGAMAHVKSKLGGSKPKYDSLTDRVKAKAKNKEAKSNAASK